MDFVSILTKLLNNSRFINHSKQIQTQILINNLNQLEPTLIQQILRTHSYNFQHNSHYIHQILQNTRNPDNVFSWSCTIRFLSQNGKYKEAFSLYVDMHRFGLSPSTFTVSSALRACAKIGFKIGGVLIHGNVCQYGFCGDVYVDSSLVNFYSKLGDMVNAQKVFDEMSDRNVVSWNSILDGYFKSGNLCQAKKVFDLIPVRDVTSWNSMVSGCAKAGDMDTACDLFRQMPDKNSASWNAVISGYVDCGKLGSAKIFFDAMPKRNSISLITMISGYSKCGDVDSARELFSAMDNKDLLSFNAMIACYAQNSRPNEAILLFKEMLQSCVNIQPDKMTFASVLSACSQLGDVEFGSWVESYMNNLGIEIDDHLATALIDLYAKCGIIDKAYKLFSRLTKRDLVSYTAMILGFGINGKPDDSIKLFQEMLHEQIFPNAVTFTGILTAYNHAGLVKEGYHCFNSMKDYGREPEVDHYGIMVDLLGRAGRLEEAYELIKSMPMRPHAGVWGALLLASRLYNNVELGEIAAKNCFELEYDDKTGYCSLLSNIYAAVERWKDVESLKSKGFAKIRGCSWTESSDSSSLDKIENSIQA